MVYATEEQPLGTAGSVRNAMDELDERFLVISGDVLTDIDLSEIVDFHEEHDAARHHRARPRSRTRSSSASSSPARTARSSGSSRSPRGARSSATRSTPASSCSSREIFDYIDRRPAGRLLRRGLPAAARRGRPSVRRRRRGLLGGRRHARGLRPGAQGRARRQGGAARHPRVPSWPTASGWGRAPRSIPMREIVGTGGDRTTTAASRAGAASARTRCSAPTCRVRDERRPRARA